MKTTWRISDKPGDAWSAEQLAAWMLPMFDILILSSKNAQQAWAKNQMTGSWCQFAASVTLPSTRKTKDSSGYHEVSTRSPSRKLSTRRRTTKRARKS